MSTTSRYQYAVLDFQSSNGTTTHIGVMATGGPGSTTKWRLRSDLARFATEEEAELLSRLSEMFQTMREAVGNADFWRLLDESLSGTITISASGEITAENVDDAIDRVFNDQGIVD